MTLEVWKEDKKNMTYFDVFDITFDRYGSLNLEYLIKHKEVMSAHWEIPDYDEIRVIPEE